MAHELAQIFLEISGKTCQLFRVTPLRLQKEMDEEDVVALSRSLSHFLTGHMLAVTSVSGDVKENDDDDITIGSIRVEIGHVSGIANEQSNQHVKIYHWIMK